MNTSTASLRIRNKSTYHLIFLVCIFFVNPLLGLLSIYLLIATSSKHAIRVDTLVKFYCIAIAVFLGAVNTSKIPENDLAWYYIGFLDAGKYGFFDYITNFGINGQGRELAFPALNYLIYQLVGANTKIYILIFTAVYYGAINLSVYKLCKSLRIPPLIIATAVFLFSIAPNIFSLSAVILRQNLAAAIIIFVIVERFSCQRNHYLLMAMAVLTHASSLFFIALCFMPGIRQKVSLKTLPLFLVITAVILTYQYAAEVAAGFFSSNNVISYALTRASTGTNYELPPLDLTKIVFNIVIFVSLYLTIYVVKPEYKENKGVVAISNIVLMTLLFIISNLNYVELSVRFNSYFLSFFPIIVAVVLSGFNYRSVFPFLIGLHPLFVILFIYGLHISMWSYVAINEVAYWPLFFYFLG